ncbi:hypothetical protein ABBQ38_002003 [Trebouxia sp. C0009 RCD-2024]
MSGSAAQTDGTDTQPSYGSLGADTGAPARDAPQQDSDDDQPNPSMHKRLKRNRVLFNEVTADDNDRINSSRHASTSASQPADLVDDDSPSLGRTTARGRVTRSRIATRAGRTGGRRGGRTGRGRGRTPPAAVAVWVDHLVEAGVLGDQLQHLQIAHSDIPEAILQNASEAYQQIRRNYYEHKTTINKGNIYKLMWQFQQREMSIPLWQEAVKDARRT